MPVFLSQTTIATVKATIPALETHGVTITQQMYDRIFEDPAIRALFDKPLHDVTRSQPVALANAGLPQDWGSGDDRHRRG